MNKIVQVDGLYKKFLLSKSIFSKKRVYFNAVNNVSFTINERESVGLVGESGSGKSTIGKLLLRLIEPTAGNILVNNKNLFQMTSYELNNYRTFAQMIFQDPYSSLNPKLSLKKTLEEVLKIKIGLQGEELNKEVLKLIDLVGLPKESLSKYPHEFSGGQRQRIVIARALAVKPKFIVADEPVSALDVSIQAQILNLLLDLKDELNLSYLFISHDLSVVKYFCNRILVMKNGSIVEEGEKEQIFNNPQHEYTKLLLDSII